MIHECDGYTHRDTYTQTPHDDIGRACIASRGKNAYEHSVKGKCKYKRKLFLKRLWDPILGETNAENSSKLR